MKQLYLASPNIHQCADQMRRGEVVAYPTEAVWGLGCDPFDEEAVNKVLELKKRDPAKGVILIAGDIKQFNFLLKDLDWSLRERLYASWPGANTWLVPHNNRVPKIISGKHETVALRVTEHPLVQALCESFGGPIVSTSANPAGLPAAKSQMQVRRYFKQAVIPVHLTKGRIGNNRTPSKIRDLVSGKILRN